MISHLFSNMPFRFVIVLFVTVFITACGGGKSSKSTSIAASSNSSILSSSVSSKILSSNSSSISSSISSSSKNTISSSSTSSLSLLAPTVTVGYGIKQIKLSWLDVDGATYYKVLKNIDGQSSYSPLSENITATNYVDTVSVHLTDWINITYIVAACNSAGCINSTIINGFDPNKAVGYFKSSNSGLNDNFGGGGVALSEDGNTLAVGAYGESSNATGIDGDQSDNSAFGAGAVYVFTRIGNNWSQQAYIKASNTDARDSFGGSIALSSDGNTLAVGAYNESSNAIGIGGNQGDNSAKSAGAVYVFIRTKNTWSQQIYIKASNTTANDLFGLSVAISADGNTLAVGARSESSRTTGVNGDQNDKSSLAAGAVYIFTRVNEGWTQEAYIKASNTGVRDGFSVVALSADGNTLAVGADAEESNANGVGGDQNNNSASGAGAVYVFMRTNNVWLQQAYVKASNTNSNDFFGTSLALSADGNTLAVGAYGESSKAVGVGGDQNDNSAEVSGAVYIFTRTGTTWLQQSYIKASDTEAYSGFSRVALSSDGGTLAVGAYPIGAVYVFTWSGNNWLQKSRVQAPNSHGGNLFGINMALSANGNILAIGAEEEASNASGINGNQNDNSAKSSGAVYIY